MIKVYLTKGLPASGKSTWAKKMVDDNPNGIKRVNKDDLRAMLDNSKYSNDSEKFILKVRDALILMAIEDGKHVIVDDTNLAPKHEARIRDLVKGKANVVIQDFTDVPLETCIERDLRRSVSVGEKVIRDMYNQFLRKTEVYDERLDLPHAIIVDIDGTLAKMSGRSPYDWGRVKEDSVNKPVAGLVSNYSGTVILVSGRDSVCRDLTIEWLWENGIRYDYLFMRESGNSEKDSIVKRRLFDQNVRGRFFIDYVLDDRNQVVEMWRNMGLTCLQVAEGDF